MLLSDRLPTKYRDFSAANRHHVEVRIVLVALALVGGCGDDDHVFMPSIPDAAGVQVSCDDPNVWSAPALGAANLRLGVDSPINTSCYVGQYPLRVVSLNWWPNDGFAPGESDSLGIACWRVVDASPGSSWTAGDRFETKASDSWMTITGFAQSLTVEGRVLRTDGTLAFATPPATAVVDEATILASNANDIVAVMSAEAWAERYAVTLAGERVTTDEVIDGSGYDRHAYTLHRIGGEIVWRSWRKPATGPLEHTDVVLGPGTRARMANWGAAVVIDDELVRIGLPNTNPFVSERIPLGGEPTEMASYFGNIILHIGDELHQYGSAGASTMTVPAGTLLPGYLDDRPSFFDGARFRVIVSTSTGIAFSETSSFSLSADTLAVIGTPRRMYFYSVVFGQTGLALAVDAQTPVAGPRAASFEQVMGGQLRLLAPDASTYVIAKDDGTSVLYDAVLGNICLP